MANAAFPQLSPDLGAEFNATEQAHDPGEAALAAAPATLGSTAVEPLAAPAPQPPRVAMAGHLMGRRRTVFAAVPIAVIKPNPLQPRQYFDPESLADLAASIRARGLLQPIIVRRGRDGEYTLVAGERRLRAAELAGLRLVPAILSDDDLLEVALEENVQREDLSPLEEAEALASLAQERGHTHAELADVIHKSRPYVSNTLALTRLPADVKQEYFRDGGGVSREILISIARQESPDAMRALWRRVKLQSISVRAFREQETEQPHKPAPDQLLRATRRFNRALRHAGALEELSDADRQTLRRGLERARKAIVATLERLAAASPAELD